MQETMQALIARFIENRDAIRAAFKMENDTIYPVCAQIYLAADKPVDRERLDSCKALVKSTAGIFSNFRGTVKLPLLCALATEDDPEERWRRTERYYDLLKKTFFGSEYLAMGALLLSDTVQEENIPDLAARGKALYQRMKKEHPFLTGQEDSVFALLLAQSPRSDDELIEDMEECYRLLGERFPRGDGHQTASHVLALKAAPPAEKATRMVDLFDAIERGGGKYGKDRQLPILAALSLQDGSVEDMARDILELDGLLSEQKGYKGIFGLDKRTRIMHAAMLLSLPDRGEGQRGVMSAAVQQVTLAMIAAQQALMCAIICCSVTTGAAAHSAH